MVATVFRYFKSVFKVLLIGVEVDIEISIFLQIIHGKNKLSSSIQFMS